MSTSRARYTATVVGAFVGGLILASGLDFTRFGWAQSKTPPKPSAATVQPLVETQNAFEAIADHVTPAVVSIQAEHLGRARGRAPRNNAPGLDEFFRQFENPHSDQPSEASGSGFIVSKDGYILTNNHVVADADQVNIHLLDNRVFPAKVIGRDPTTDIAVLKIDANDLPTVSMGDDATTRVGQWVVAIGNPLGLDFTVTAGIVSAKGRTLQGLLNTPYAIQDYIQTDAAINPGNSGGPLVNIRGEVVGINSAIASSTGFYAGYGFAIPITLARQVMDDIIKYGRVRRAVLGINITEVDPNDAKVAGLTAIKGVKVIGYDPVDNPDQSPAKRAGIEIGDVITAIQGQEVDRVSSLQRVVRGFKPGQTVDVTVMRLGKKQDVNVKLAEPPAERTDVAANDNEEDDAAPAASTNGRSYDKLGISVAPLPAAYAAAQRVGAQFRNGLLVTSVTVGGPAYRNLLTNRDIIIGVNYPKKASITSPADLQNLVSGLKDGDLVQLVLYDALLRGTRVVTLRVGGQQ